MSPLVDRSALRLRSSCFSESINSASKPLFAGGLLTTKYSKTWELVESAQDQDQVQDEDLRYVLNLCPLRSRQCQNGHSACHGCISNMEHCASCKVSLRNKTRNLMVEKLLTFMTIKCKHVGCTQTLSFAQKLEHEATCLYRPLRCFYPGCTVSAVDAHVLIAHLRGQHKFAFHQISSPHCTHRATLLNDPLKDANSWRILYLHKERYYMLSARTTSLSGTKFVCVQMYKIEQGYHKPTRIRFSLGAWDDSGCPFYSFTVCPRSIRDFPLPVPSESLLLLETTALFCGAPPGSDRSANKKLLQVAVTVLADPESMLKSTDTSTFRGRDSPSTTLPAQPSTPQTNGTLTPATLPDQSTPTPATSQTASSTTRRKNTC
eukprot:gb/GEZN01010407.1/.p1 GENE.gb/GEZN01010407.1/~~gb/GEZN01010407.1/.p1  ORF type:complete len:391 (+),score=33.70 gb/GEZN01010407.1/:48-1175(+)